MKRGTKTVDKQTLQFDKGFADDLEVRQLLTEKGWLFEEYQVVYAKKELRWGLVRKSQTAVDFTATGLVYTI